MNNSNPSVPEWKRKELKKMAKLAVRKNYVKVVVISLLTFFFVQGFYSFSNGSSTTGSVSLPTQAASNSTIVNDYLNNSDNALAKLMKPYLDGKSGLMATLFDNFTDSGSFVFGILNAANKAMFGDHIGYMFIILIGLLITLAFRVFVRNIIKVGSSRFFLENANYEETSIGRIAFIYQIGKTGNTALCMFMLSVYQTLWNLTIIGGIIKKYSYRMVPYIVAENPGIKFTDAILLSRKMMKGNKWRAFILDFSFIFWILLGSITLGIVDYLYVFPYRTQTDANLYLALRKGSMETVPQASKWLTDVALVPEAAIAGPYPLESYIYPIHEKRQWNHLDYMKKYSIWSLILIFISLCLIGWIWEVSLNFFVQGKFVNRGVLHGPWLPIYGYGGILMLVLLRRFRNRPFLFFGLSMVVCGILEYTVAWWLETFKGHSWWDYHSMLFNLQGRICLEGLLFFALGGLMITYVLAPALDKLFCKIPGKVLRPLCIIIMIVFLIDFFYSQGHPKMDASKEVSQVEYSETVYLGGIDYVRNQC